MRNCVRLFILLLLTFLNSGCYSFFRGGGDVRQEKNTIAIMLETGADVNPDREYQAQPIKVCVIDSLKAGWIPPRAFEGSVCSDIPVTVDITGSEQYILAPGVRKEYNASLNDGKAHWFIIGAEFQQGSVVKSLVEYPVEKNTDAKVRVFIDKTSLTVIEQ